MTDRNDRYNPEQYGGLSNQMGEFDSPEAAAIRADIERTRERMSETVEDIGERLNPQRLKAQLKSNIHDATIGKAEHMARVAYGRVDETRHTIMDNIRENPIPAAMVGIGLGWLLWGGRKREEHTYEQVDRFGGTTPRFYSPIYDDTGIAMERDTRAAGAMNRVSELKDTAREKAENLTHRAENLAHTAQDRVTEMAQDARDTVHGMTERAHDLIDTGTNRARMMAGDFADQTRMRSHRMEDRFDEALHDTPLAVGAAAMALGLAIGLSAPATRRESELMGAKRDELFSQAREKAGEVTGRVHQIADRLVEQTEATVRQTVRDEGLV